MANRLPATVNSNIYYCYDLRSFHDSQICPFAHARDLSDLKEIDVRRIVCSFNLARKCKYKDNCMFAHLITSESDSDTEVVQEESSSRPDASFEPVPARELSPENVSPHLSQGPDGFELGNGNIVEEFGKENKCDIIRKPNELNPLAKDLLEKPGDDLRTAAHLPTERLAENWNGSILDPIAPSTSLTSEGPSISNSAKAIITPIHSAESARRNNRSDLVPQKQLEKETNAKCGDCLELIATDEPSVSQQFALVAEASTTQPSNNGNEELESVSTAPSTECPICLIDIGSTGPHTLLGILANCDHIFCFKCITKWRERAKGFVFFEVPPYLLEYYIDQTLVSFEQAQQELLDTVAPEVARSCPICRKLSYFVVPSNRLIEGESEKNELIAEYKDKRCKINCRYYSSNGECNFGKYCFYMHAAFYCNVLRAKYNFN